MKTLIFLTAFFLVLSCGGSSTKDSGTQDNEALPDSSSQNDDETLPASNDEDSAVSSGKIEGSFAVRLVSPVAATAESEAKAGYTTVSGKIYNGKYPSAIIWEESEKSGNCTLLTPRVPFCETPCGGSAVCVEDNICTDYPKLISAGAVTVKGVKTADGAKEFVIKNVGNNYQSAISLPFDSFGDGDELSVSGAGGDVKAFEIKSSGIAPLEVTTENLILESGKGLVLDWIKPSKTEISNIHISVDISHHGGKKGTIECDSLDSGNIEIPAVLVDKLVSLGIAGFPKVTLTRYSESLYKSDEGTIKFSVLSDSTKEIEIPGLVSCNDDVDCPENQKCQDDRTCK